ncbi:MULTISPECIES: hypothetical protein [Bacillus]|uniref:Uncharacterized protein n=2 Tax=Bacillus TaxID=1386 RepID=A0A0M3R8S5_9BACI|nr:MULTISPECIES: hypothetical protein [Bacillus]ALC80192.1 hypothetical protein AM592_00190 [Bacillus gobiensis]MBP1082831.1 hypothetical protein [Bacillus capparidis]MED1098471.1 hypothetical protein [Bacillus capparidis]
MKYSKKLLLVTSCTALLSASLMAAPEANADSSRNEPIVDSQNASNATPFSDELVEKIDRYVKLNSNGKFKIASEKKLLEFLTPDELAVVKSQIKSANENIADIVKRDKSNPGTVSVNNNQMTLSIKDSEITGKSGGFQIASEGVTKVDFYWWGMRVYLSKTVINTASAASIGAAGYLGTQIPHGVQIKFNYIVTSPHIIPTEIKYQ